MSLSIRARLTAWYSAIVICVLAVAAVVGALVQARLAGERMDEDLARTMATLQGVMRNEFSEGLDLHEAAAEASIEVVAPDRSMAICSDAGQLIVAWGLQIDTAVFPCRLDRDDLPPYVVTDVYRIHVQDVTADTPVAYRAVVAASTVGLDQEHVEMVRAMAVGLMIALVVAAAGGWFIGRHTLRPLRHMADQASRVNEQAPSVRLDIGDAADELRVLASSFNELLDRLATALQQQRQFMADASHELRTPVSVVRTSAQVTLSSPERTREEYRESMQIVEEQSGRLARLVDAMFLLSRAEARGVPLRKEFVNVDDIVEESVRAFRVIAAQRGVSVETGGEQEVGLTADDGLLRQMIGNLLDNATRHALPDGHVMTDLSRADGVIVLRVSNDGPEIPAADRERIFARFARGTQSTGAGLGLPIARWIAEAHGGSVALEHSEPGHTTFVVRLPEDRAHDPI